jgi:hypothetical protein
MLVDVRPSNEALQRARVPGAQDQRGCPSNPLYHARSASKKDGLVAPYPTLPSLLVPLPQRVALTWEPSRLQRGPYTGRGAKPAGLVSDRTLVVFLIGDDPGRLQPTDTI